MVCLKTKRSGITKNLFQFQKNYKVSPCVCNVLSHPPLPCIYALLEGFFWDVPQFYYYSLLESLQAFKICLLNETLELGEKKVRWHKRLFHYRWVYHLVPKGTCWWNQAFFCNGHTNFDSYMPSTTIIKWPCHIWLVGKLNK